MRDNQEQVKRLRVEGCSRLDRALASVFDGEYSRSQLAKLFALGAVYDEAGTVLKPSTRLQSGGAVCVDVSALDRDVVCQNGHEIPLEILYEDEDVIVINKPQGMVVHPGAGREEDTLMHALLYHCAGKLSRVNPERPGIVHRLDKDTAGLMLAAKNRLSHERLARDFATHAVQREYRCLCRGHFAEKSGTIRGAIGRDPKNRLRMAIRSDGKAAETDFTVLEEFRDGSELRLRLKTGRTHQIRVHLSAIRHPIFGDPIYGAKEAALPGLSGQCLYSESLRFVHPRSGETLFFKIEMPSFYREVKERLCRDAGVFG